MAPEATNDMREKMSPAAGQQFLWVTVKAADAQTINLTKVAVAVGANAAPLIGVDSEWDGDPKQFSMIAPVTLVKTGKPSDPMEMTHGGALAFAFTPGKMRRSKSRSRRRRSVCCSVCRRISKRGRSAALVRLPCRCPR